MPIVAASGYPQYSGLLIPPQFNTDLIVQFYCSSVYSDITTTEYTGDIRKCGDQVTFFRSPKVTVRRGSKDGSITHDTFDTSPVTMTIDQELEFSIKVAQVDIEQICAWSKWESALLKSASYEMNETIDQDLLASSALQVAAVNKGATAGVKTARYNLGTAGAPITITKTNIWEELVNVRAVLREQCLPMNDVFIVLPDVAEVALLNSPLLNSNAGLAAKSEVASGNILNGKLPMQIAGFDIYFSHNVSSATDGGGLAYNCVAGWRGATAFAAQIEKSRIIDNDKDSWDTYIQGMMVYGSKVIRPEGLALAYWKF